jgi:acyl-CoA synthetase (AMP-forming)/AMP-acid ligase II
MERSVSTGTRIEAAPLSVSAGESHRAITERVLGRADQAGHRAAVIDAVDGTVTAWPRLAWTIRAAAHGLSRRGLADGDTAAVFVQDAARFAIAVNAIRATGATALPIRPDASMADVAGQLNACGVRLLITAAPLAEFAAEAADRSQVRQVFTFGESAGTTPFRSLLTGAEQGTDTHKDGSHGTGANGPLDGADNPEAGLSDRDVVVAGPPCGDGQAYRSLVDLTLLAGATLVAAPVPLLTAAMRVYQATAAIVPYGTAVSGVPPDRIFAVALPESPPCPRG